MDFKNEVLVQRYSCVEEMQISTNIRRQTGLRKLKLKLKLGMPTQVTPAPICRHYSVVSSARLPDSRVEGGGGLVNTEDKLAKFFMIEIIIKSPLCPGEKNRKE